jgi:O-antigen/teichoic acid export membrane protein
VRRHIVPLFAANAIALGTVGLSYLLYSRLLSAQQFGIYSAALAVGNIAVLVLDGGVKVSIIKHADPPTRSEEGALLHLMLSVSLVLLLAVVSFRSLTTHFYPALANQAGFVATFTGVYLLTYPWICLSTAQLERNLSYSRLAWIESTGLILERGAPVVFLYFTDLGMYSFVWSLALGRFVRVMALARFHSVPLVRVPWDSYRSAVQFLREGIWYQIGIGSSTVRDNLHILLVGPLYGAAWVGYYAWGQQLCMLTSQVFVQISARVSLPLAARSSAFVNRWPTVIRQIGILAAITAPMLAGALLLAPAAVHQMFTDKWQPALALLPYLFLRMLPGAATAPIGAITLVERGARAFAHALWLWTLAEVAMGATAVWLLGVEGLAVSYSIAALIGMYLLLRGLERPAPVLFVETLRAIFGRASVAASLVLAIAYKLADSAERDWLTRVDLGWNLGLVSVLVIAFYAIDSDLRSLLLRGKK